MEKKNYILGHIGQMHKGENMVKRYYIKDLQYGSNWWEWTKDEPLTKSEILEMFREYAYNDDIELPKNRKDFNFNFIQDLWECEIKEVK